MSLWKKRRERRARLLAEFRARMALLAALRARLDTLVAGEVPHG